MFKKIPKHYLVISLALIILLGLWQGNLRSATNSQVKEHPLVTVTTSFLKDIVTQIAGDTVNIALIIPAGVDPHLYNASAGDLEKILDTDLLLYHGLHFEAQMATALEDYGFAVTRNFSEASLNKVAEDSTEIDPHYWFNLDLYTQSVNEARDILIETFPEHAETFRANNARYLAELAELDQWITDKLAELPIDQRILVTPHDAFGYLAQMNQFIVYSPQGISTQAEVSNDQIVQTVAFIIEHQVPAIFLDTTSNPQAMEKLKEGVEQFGQEIAIIGGEGAELYADSLAAEGQANDNYIDMYKHNLSIIVDHLTH